MSTDEQHHRTGIAIVGSLNADISVATSRLPRPGETLHGRDASILPGGKGANQAVAAARLGAQVTLIGAVGEDSNGSLLVSSAREAGVATERIRTVSDVASGLALITVDAAGENTIVLSPGANAHLAASDVRTNADAITGASVLGLCLELDLGVVTEAAGIAHAAGVTVLTNLSPYHDGVERLLALTDVLLVNEHEAAQLIGDDRISREGLIAGLRQRGISRAIITMGGNGCTVVDGASPVVHVEAIRVPVVDTTGCGDAFMGATATLLSEGATLLEAARFAVRVAGIAAGSRGAQPSYPDRRAVEPTSPGALFAGGVVGIRT